MSPDADPIPAAVPRGLINFQWATKHGNMHIRSSVSREG